MCNEITSFNTAKAPLFEPMELIDIIFVYSILCINKPSVMQYEYKQNSARLERSFD